MLQLPAGTAALAQAPLPACDLKAHGARGDGKTNDAGAIQRAIDACAASGGGMVCFPPGDYLTGTLLLKSSVILHLSPGATIWGSRSVADYNPRHLIYAKDADNIGIQGQGTINGQGDAYFQADFRPVKERLGPMIELINCRDVHIRDVRIRNSPRWTVHPKNCDRVFISGISIINHMRGPNTDGIDPDSSRNVHISDCYIEAGDDCIVLKTTNVLPWIPAGYGEPVRPCENVVVTNCTLISSASALKLGTESLADIRHCVFSNCVIRDSRTGLALLGKDGGVFENVSFSNISISTMPKHGSGPSWPIAIDLERRYKDSRVGRIRDINFSDIQISTKGRVLVGGMSERAVEQIRFHNIRMSVTGFVPVEKTRKMSGGIAEASVPADDFGWVPSALIFANTRGLDLRDIRVQWDTEETPQERHAIYGAKLEDVRIESFNGRAAKPGGTLAAIDLRDSRNVLLSGCRAGGGAKLTVHLSGIPEDQFTLDDKDARTVVERE